MNENDEPNFRREEKPKGINVNTGISISLAIMIGTFGFWIKDGQTQSELQRVKDAADSATKMAELRVEIANLSRDMADKTRDRFTYSDMFRWAVQLQKVNTDAGVKIIVPEPGRPSYP